MRCAKYKSFTLIEMISVLSIALVLFVVALPKLSMPEDQLRLRYEAELLRGVIRYAQTLAMQDERKTIVGGIEFPEVKVVFTGNSYSIVRSGYPVPVVLPHTSEADRFLDGITLTPTNFSITFDSWGSPGDTDITITMTLGLLTETITVYGNTGFVQ